MSKSDKDYTIGDIIRLELSLIQRKVSALEKDETEKTHIMAGYGTQITYLKVLASAMPDILSLPYIDTMVIEWESPLISKPAINKAISEKRPKSDEIIPTKVSEDVKTKLLDAKKSVGIKPIEAKITHIESVLATVREERENLLKSINTLEVDAVKIQEDLVGELIKLSQHKNLASVGIDDLLIQIEQAQTKFGWVLERVIGNHLFFITPHYTHTYFNPRADINKWIELGSYRISIQLYAREVAGFHIFPHQNNKAIDMKYMNPFSAFRSFCFGSAQAAVREANASGNFIFGISTLHYLLSNYQADGPHKTFDAFTATHWKHKEVANFNPFVIKTMNLQGLANGNSEIPILPQVVATLSQVEDLPSIIDRALKDQLIDWSKKYERRNLVSTGSNPSSITLLKPLPQDQPIDSDFLYKCMTDTYKFRAFIEAYFQEAIEREEGSPVQSDWVDFYVDVDSNSWCLAYDDDHRKTLCARMTDDLIKGESPIKFKIIETTNQNIEHDDDGDVCTYPYTEFDIIMNIYDIDFKQFTFRINWSDEEADGNSALALVQATADMFSRINFQEMVSKISACSLYNMNTVTLSRDSVNVYQGWNQLIIAWLKTVFTRSGFDKSRAQDFDYLVEFIAEQFRLGNLGAMTDRLPYITQAESYMYYEQD